MDITKYWTQFSAIMSKSIDGMSLGDIATALGILLLAYLFKKVFFWGLVNRMLAQERSSIRFYSKLLARTHRAVSFFIMLLGFYFALKSMPLNDTLVSWINKGFEVGVLIAVFWALMGFSNALLEHLADRYDGKGYLPIAKKSVGTVVLLMGALVLFSSLGYNITGAIATLGVGGIAIAVAAKDSLSNLFGSLSIILDKPFKVGDRIEVSGKLHGTVLSLGFRSTHIKTLDASMLSIPNTILANEVINNWTLMEKRRVRQVIGVTYSTTSEQMNAIIEDIRNFILADDEANIDRVLVFFRDFGSSSLDIMVDYFTQSTAWAEHLAVKQRINFEIMKIVERNGASMAFPSQSVYFENSIGVEQSKSA